MPSLSNAAQRVQNALTAGGFDCTVIEKEQTTRTAKDAAAALGCEVAQIAKSLIFRTRAGKNPLLVIASGPNRVDEARLEQAAGEAVEKADADFVLEHTGYAIGGVPPLGHKEALLTLIDADLMKLNPIWAAAGTPNAVFSLTPDQLLAMTGGQVVEIKVR